MIELCCPACKTLLQENTASSPGPIECPGCHVRYPAIGPVRVMLTAHSTQKNDVMAAELGAWNRNSRYYLDETALPLYQLIHRRKLDTFRLQSEGPRVLDVGSGTGYIASCLTADGKEVAALDFSADMLLLGAGVHKVSRWINGSVDALPFPDASFDAVVANGVFHHLKGQGILDAGVREIVRVLKPGGVLCYFDRNGSRLSRYFHKLVMLTKKMIVRIGGPFASSSSENEPDFCDKDIAHLIDGAFVCERRSYVTALPVFFLIVVTNTAGYLFGRKAQHRAQDLFLPVARYFEFHAKRRWFTVEQCVKLRKN